MESSLALLAIFSLLLVGNAIGARKEPGEYWRNVMKDQPMPKAIQGLVDTDQSSPLSTNKPKCETTEHEQEMRRPTFWVYDGHDNKLIIEGKAFVKDFDPEPTVTAFYD